MQKFHVAGVGGVAVEHFGCPEDTTHDLSKRRILKIGQSCPGLIIPESGQKEIPQAFSTGFGLQFFHEGHGIPALVDFLVPLSDPWNDVLVHEGAEPDPQRFDCWRISKIHNAMPGRYRAS